MLGCNFARCGTQLSKLTTRCQYVEWRRSPAHSASHPDWLWPDGCAVRLDEPSIGLHQRDNGRLLNTLKHLRDLGNTVLVVEHDEDTIRAADYLLDIGPGAGIHGGHVVAAGSPAEVMKVKTA